MKKVVKILFCLAAALMLTASVAFAATLTGMVEEGDSGLVLMVGEETYVMEGEGLDEFLGEKVNVAGEVNETENGKVITVTEISVAE